MNSILIDRCSTFASAFIDVVNGPHLFDIYLKHHDIYLHMFNTNDTEYIYTQLPYHIEG